ncbi:o-succinylbenzoate synthase [Alkalihalobacillus sp. AL-G]|nr:o-succinylbenzoate synthase [Alkalihalobacillus sp. AL-G]WLD95447.1 o-succinylbenzoate synthase [Alkalihalobacillus sp. AL-G]
MNVKKITIHTIELQLKNPFVTALGKVENRPFLISEVEFECGIIGWGECSAFRLPWYTEETTETCRYALSTFLIPAMLNQRNFQHPDELSKLTSQFRGHHMAKSCLETALWDGYAKSQNKPLYEVLGGTRDQIEVGIAIGLQTDKPTLLKKVEGAVEQGYKRIKIKIQPGTDIDVIESIRETYPDIPLMVDANSGYTLNDTDRLKRFDPFNLMMIEQPLRYLDFVDHAKLQQQMSTPICLDESICSLDDVRTAIELGSAQVITIKMSRVGGLSEAKRIHDLCLKNGLRVWAGGMLETGIGRAHNIALATLDGFTIPGDISASANYWREDIIEPEIIVDRGSIHCSEQAGIGYDISRQILEQHRTELQIYT